MLARTHLAFGALTGLLLYPVVQPSNAWLYAGMMALGSLLPDIDTPQSTLGRKFFGSRALSLLFGHRGIFHSIWAPAALLLAGYYWNFWDVAVFMAIGYASHIFSDSLTVAGVNLIHPVEQLRIAGFVRTGTIMESLVFLLIVGLIIAKVIGIGP
ncbi:metal-dependent hydrolase [Candidatus Woesearchaeota archaeon]|nr:metal-dependent hydrolase [Candidatus Woesearchaeota archaeon]